MNASESYQHDASLKTDPWNIAFPDGVSTWYSDAAWNILSARERNSPLMWRARKTLASIFDDVWLREQTFQSHPISILARFRYSRWRLFRLALAFDVLHAPDRIRNKLRHPREFLGCVPELDFGLFLRCTGAKVELEPLFPELGPDTAATWNERVFFEVKSPDFSDAFKAIESAAAKLSMEFSAMTRALSHLSGWALELRIEEDVLTAAAHDEARLAEILDELREDVTHWASHPRAGLFRPKRPSSFHARRWQCPGISVGGPGYCCNADHELMRLRKHLFEANEQLSATGAPGFVVFSGERHSLLRNHVRPLMRVVREDKSLLHVAGLIFYSLEPNDVSRRLIPRVHVYVRPHYATLLPSRARLRRGGDVLVAPL